jgi:hypothetical protein
MPLQFSSEVDRFINDLKVCHRRIRDATNADHFLSPLELVWVERKLATMLEELDGEER